MMVCTARTSDYLFCPITIKIFSTYFSSHLLKMTNIVPVINGTNEEIILQSNTSNNRRIIRNRSIIYIFHFKIVILSLLVRRTSTFAISHSKSSFHLLNRQYLSSAPLTQLLHISKLNSRTSPFTSVLPLVSKMSLLSSTTNDSPTNKYKRTKISPSETTIQSTKVIATHNGTFQADEALGVWLLRQTQTYRNSSVVRTRDAKIYDQADIVIDVGGVYNHDEKKYDHHQRDYNERFHPKLKWTIDENSDEKKQVPIERCTKLSASGLVYRHYGKEVISTFYPNLTEEDVELVYLKLYNSFMESVDAVDTGVEPVPEGVDMIYRDCTGLSSRVARLNPRWNEEDDGIVVDPDERFEQAVAMCGGDFLSILTKIVESDLPAYNIVEQSVLTRHTVDPSGEIIVFPNGGIPWKSHLYDLEKEHNIDPLIKFVLYTDQSGMWRVQAVTVQGQNFTNRVSLPEKWRGVRDSDLESISGIEGCTFCHASGFIGGNKTFEGALEMARVSLK